MREPFLMTLDDEPYEDLRKRALEHNMNVQKFLRHIVIPEWLRNQQMRKK